MQGHEDNMLRLQLEALALLDRLAAEAEVEQDSGRMEYISGCTSEILGNIDLDALTRVLEAEGWKDTG